MTVRPSFLFVHGWCFAASIWDGVRAALPDAWTDVTEHGYFGASPRRPAVPAGTVVVGHSAGVPELLSDLPAGCAGLVAINGFTRLAAGIDHPAGVPARLLDRMLLRLQQDPGATAAAFRARCGAAGPLPGIPQPGLLRTGLRALRDADARGAGVRLLALAGCHDPIVPPVLTRACFAEAAIVWHDRAGHLLPLSHPGWCAGQLQAFAATAGRAV